MKKTLTLCNFRDEFVGTQYKYQFSYTSTKSIKALEMLFDYYNDLDEQTECDIVAISCDWTEYEDFDHVKYDYKVESMGELENKTIVLKVSNGNLLILNY